MKSSIDLSLVTPSQLATEVVGLYSSWSVGRAVWLKRVKEVISYVYATSTRETTNNVNPWSHSTVIPKLTQIHDNLGANYSSALFGVENFFDFSPATLGDAAYEKRKAILAYLTTKHHFSGFLSAMERLLNDWVQTGNCFCRVSYDIQKAVDPITKEEYIQYEGPVVHRISPYDIVFDYTLEKFQDSPKIFRELVSRGELIRKTSDSNGEQAWDMGEVKKVQELANIGHTAQSGDVNKTFQMQMDGFSEFSSYLQSGKVELLHFVGDIWDKETQELQKDRHIIIADKQFVLLNEAIDDRQGYGNIYHAGWRLRPDNLWAQGPLENLVGMQYLINHLENARADGFDQMLQPDMVYQGNVEVQTRGARKIYYVDEAAGNVMALAPNAVVLSADNQIQYKEAQMEAYAGAPREAMGIRTPGEKTAFEIQQLENAAGRLFQHKIETFERDLLEPVLSGELQVSVNNLNREDTVRIMDEDFGVQEFLSITPESLNVRGKLVAMGASHFAKRAQFVQELQQFENVLAGDQSLAVHFPALPRARAWDMALGFDKYNLMQPFGQIAEGAKAHEVATAAQQSMDETTAAAGTDANAVSEAQMIEAANVPN